AFSRRVLREALAFTDDDATDEAALAERAGHPVRIVDGAVSNIKITTAGDLPLAEAIAAGRESRAAGSRGVMRTGTGYDLHRLRDGRPPVVGRGVGHAGAGRPR